MQTVGSWGFSTETFVKLSVRVIVPEKIWLIAMLTNEWEGEESTTTSMYIYTSTFQGVPIKP